MNIAEAEEKLVQLCNCGNRDALFPDWHERWCNYRVWYLAGQALEKVTKKESEKNE